MKLNVVITPSGVLTTELIASEEDETECLKLYEKIRPQIRCIDAILRVSMHKRKGGKG